MFFFPMGILSRCRWFVQRYCVWVSVMCHLHQFFLTSLPLRSWSNKTDANGTLQKPTHSNAVRTTDIYWESPWFSIRLNVDNPHLINYVIQCKIHIKDIVILYLFFILRWFDKFFGCLHWHKSLTQMNVWLSKLI